MAAASIQTAWTVLGLHSDSAQTYSGLKGRVFFWKGLWTPHGLIRLHSDCPQTLQTAWTVLGVLADWGVQSKVLP